LLRRGLRTGRLQLAEVIDHWQADQIERLPAGRSPNLHSLRVFLVDDDAFSGAYKSVRKFARDRLPAGSKRPLRRIETPPAAQVQSDWLETNISLTGSDGVVELVKLDGFVMA